ncbi:MAG: hypothetical protein MSA54_05590 [Campylobacter sp.]|uniref:hypothetical protein n=1 Tax=Campylobacter sp. TaxID=205 RepID=UPI002AA67B66|nr:hypothetical protein [Campylobacter sp.]MCI7014647.1 hypothetical protein [Campylobacter sp.]MCI7501399.1 hypothetical protein [Campylobacter sp.]
MPNSKLFLKYRQLNDDEQKEHFYRRLSYLRANMREYIKDKPVFNTASFARDVEAMRMWSEFISRISKLKIPPNPQPADAKQKSLGNSRIP